MNWKRAIEHLGFVGPGSVLLAVSLFGLIAAFSSLQEGEGLVSWYSIGSLAGAVVATLILLKTKVGTLLLFALLVPLVSCVVWLIDSNRFSFSAMSTSALMIYLIVVNGRRQIRYHCGARNAEQDGAPNPATRSESELEGG